MKQILIVITTLILILTLHFIQSSFLNRSHELLTAKINKLEEEIMTENNESKINAMLQEIKMVWNKKELGFGTFCEHDAVEGVKENIANITRYISLIEEDDDIKLYLLMECNILKERINVMVENEKLKLTNVL